MHLTHATASGEAQYCRPAGKHRIAGGAKDNRGQSRWLPACCSCLGLLAVNLQTTPSQHRRRASRADVRLWWGSAPSTKPTVNTAAPAQRVHVLTSLGRRKALPFLCIRIARLEETHVSAVYCSQSGSEDCQQIGGETGMAALNFNAESVTLTLWDGFR